MIYNLKYKSDQDSAIERLQWLISNERRIVIKDIRNNRTLSQNAYMHLLLNYFAIEVGEELEFIKQDIFKEKVNPEIFVYERTNPKSGKKRKAIKSTSEIDTKEMATAIDRFKTWSVKKTGIRLPEAGEKEFLDHIKNEIEKHKEWL